MRRSVFIPVVCLAVTCLAGCAGVAAPADGPRISTAPHPRVSTTPHPTLRPAPASSMSAMPPLPTAASPIAGQWRGTGIQGAVPGTVSAAGIRIDFEPLTVSTGQYAWYPQVRSTYQECPAVWSTSFRLDAGQLSMGDPAPVPASLCSGADRVQGATWLADFLAGPLAVEQQGSELVLAAQDGVSLTLHRG